MKWFYAQGQQQMGPVEDSEFDRLIQTGVIRPETLVWREGMANWQNLASVRVPAPPSPPPAETSSAPASPSSPSPAPAPSPAWQQPQPAAQPAWQPAVAGTAFGQPASIYGAQMGGVHYAGFWIRFLARVIDAVILFIIRLPFSLIFGLGGMVGGFSGRPGVLAPMLGAMFGASFLLQLVISVAYEVYFVTTRGATPGKMALGLKIVQADGSPIPVNLAIGRFFASWASAIIFMIGYIMAGFDQQKRALHDRICDTRVIKTGGM